MTFPYPLTPEVRADLWRFFCPTISEEHIAEMVAVHVHPTLHPYTVTPRDEALLDTPFARAFVAWREVRAGLAAEAAHKASPSEERNCYTCRHNFIPAHGPAGCRNPDPEYNPDRAMAVYRYSVTSGAHESSDGMPKDRTMQCPGFSSKVTP